jgi:CRISPR-associated endoribonuclease Cas6
MQFKLTLLGQKGSLIPINYQYPLSACIYRIIQRADAAYSLFLHEKGHTIGDSHKAFKLFTFSNLSMPCKRIDDRLQLQSTQAEMQIAFHMPETAEKFVIGIFKDQHIEIADRYSKATFTVNQVEALPGIAGHTANPEEMIQATLQPLSPIVVGHKNERGHYTYLSPEHKDFIHWLLHNVAEKMVAVGMNPSLIEKVYVETSWNSYGPKSRLIAIKEGTDAETKVKGFTQFYMKVDAPACVLDLMMNAGVGLYNAQGIGCVGVVRI